MYKTEVDRVEPAQWHEILPRFADASIYQTWSFAAARWGEQRLSHLVLRKNGEIVAAAQVVLSRLPIPKTGIAHLKFGPMWQLPGQQRNVEVYRHMLRALREEYAERRGLLVRIKPWETGEDKAFLQSLREAERFSLQRNLSHYTTYVIDLSLSQETLYQRLKSNWRRHLKAAQRHDIQISLMDGVQAIDIFLRLYQEMRARKRFHDTSEATLLKKFYTELPSTLRPQIIISTFRGEHIAADVISAPGDTGFCLFGVASPLGRELCASYLSLWWSLEQFRQQGCRWCDLVGGYADIGLRQFKAGLAGGKHAQLEHMGDYDARGSIASVIAVGLGSSLRNAKFALRERISGRRHG